MLGRPAADFVAEEEREDARRDIAEMLREGRPPFPVERTFLTRDGRRLIVAIENRARLDASGRVVGLRRTVRDVTARRKAEAALVASERRHCALFDGIEDGIFVHDLPGASSTSTRPPAGTWATRARSCWG